ncbi:MAG: response regulator [bacterium]
MASILVVDDSAAFRDVIRRMLAKVGHDVTTTSDGQEAIRLLANGPLPDLVITDLIMPNQEGIETIIIIRERFPTVKIVAMSGGGQVGALDYLSSAMAMGAHQTLSKPFSIDGLRSAVTAALVDE